MWIRWKRNSGLGVDVARNDEIGDKFHYFTSILLHLVLARGGNESLKDCCL